MEKTHVVKFVLYGVEFTSAPQTHLVAQEALARLVEIDLGHAAYLQKIEEADDNPEE